MKQKLKEIMINRRVPYNTTIELTYRCNFKCIHCYQTPIRQMDHNEMSSNEVKKILDILKDKGCRFITFIGGEVFLRKDFLEIYKYAYDKNFKIGIITNGSLINEEQVEFLSKHKPSNITVSIYGATNNTYKKFTGFSNGFDIVRRNLTMLVKSEIEVKLLVIANKINNLEIKDIKNLSEKLGVRLTLFSNIRSFDDGNKAPLKLRLSPKKYIETLRDIGDDYSKNEQAYEELDKIWKDNIKFCSAAINECRIDPEGKMFLCANCNDYKISILENGFDFSWDQLYIKRKNEIEIESPCGKCKNRNICGLCTPAIKKQYGKICKPIDECEMGRVIRNLLLEKGVKIK